MKRVEIFMNQSLQCVVQLEFPKDREIEISRPEFEAKMWKIQIIEIKISNEIFNSCAILFTNRTNFSSNRSISFMNKRFQQQVKKLNSN